MSIVFEHLLSCGSCNKALLVADLRSSRTMMDKDIVGLTVRHGFKWSSGSLGNNYSQLAVVVDDELPEAPPEAEAESTTSRQVLYIEDCATPKSRRKFSQDWGLRWLTFEQHFETIASWSGSSVGKCWCDCHHAEVAGVTDGGPGSAVDACSSADSTLGLIGLQRGSSSTEIRGRELGRGINNPSGRLSERGGRTRGADVSLIEQNILSWREQCQREGQ